METCWRAGKRPIKKKRYSTLLRPHQLKPRATSTSSTVSSSRWSQISCGMIVRVFGRVKPSSSLRNNVHVIIKISWGRGHICRWIDSRRRFGDNNVNLICPSGEREKIFLSLLLFSVLYLFFLSFSTSVISTFDTQVKTSTAAAHSPSEG